MNLFELFVKIGAKDEASDKISRISQSLGNGLKNAAKIGVAAVGTASTAIGAFATAAINSFAEFEQLSGGAAKIFDELDQTEILKDANNAYKELGLSANQYLAVINDVGATFAATMGDEAGYNTAKIGLKAISDYASGTGKNVDELSQKFTLITRSTSSYQSIADQFSGILPATSADFLEQAQAADILSDSYEKLTEVPIDEYQEAVAKMLEIGVENLGLANNTVLESETTISGSLAATKAAWENLITGFATGGDDLDQRFDALIKSASNVVKNLKPVFSNVLSNIGTAIKTEFPKIARELPKLISDFLPDLIDSGASMVSAIIDGVVDNADTLIEAGSGMIDKLLGNLSSGAGDAANVGVDLVSKIVSGFSGNVKTLLTEGTKAISDFVVSLSSPENLNKLVTAGGDLLKNLGEGIANGVSNLASAATTILDNIGTYLFDEGGMSKILSMGTEFVVNVGTAIIDAVPDLLSSAVQLVSDFVSYIFSKEGLKAIWDAGKRIVTELGNAILDAAPTVLDVLGSVFKAAGLPVSPFEITTEVIDGEEYAVITQGGWKTTTIGPNTTTGRSGRGGTIPNETNIVNNIYGAEGQSAAEIADEVADRLTSEMQRRIAP